MVLESWLIACQQLYNAALEQRRDCWRKQHRSLSYIDQAMELTALRLADESWRGVPVIVARSALLRLQRAFDGFFRRLHTEQTPGFPRFKSRDRYSSFGIGRAKIDGDRVDVPKLGLVRFHRYRELRGDIRDVSVGRRADRWYVYISCDLGEAPAKVEVRSAIGIDVGLNVFAALSNGESISNPRFLRRAETVLVKRQHAFTRKRRGSAGRARAKLLVAKAHQAIRNQRADHAWKIANDLARRFDLIAVENLQIQNMVRSKLAKSIGDAAWGKLIHAITCKAEEAGKTVVAVDPRGTSQRCSSCGAIVKKGLSERIHRCPRCGLTIDRDLNAAINIRALGLSAVAATETLKTARVVGETPQ